MTVPESVSESQIKRLVPALSKLADEWMEESTHHPNCKYDEDCVGCAAEELQRVVDRAMAEPDAEVTR